MELVSVVSVVLLVLLVVLLVHALEGKLHQLEAKLEHSFSKTEARIAALEQKLRQPPHTTNTRAKTNHAHTPPIPTSRTYSSGYVPRASTASCYDLKPCLHTSAHERLAIGCPETVWDGAFGNQTSLIHEKQRDAEYDRVAAPIRESSEPFVPFDGGVDKCDLSDIALLTKLNRAPRIKEAVEQHFHRRLLGVKNSVWLLLGSSLEDDFTKKACSVFQMTLNVNGPYYGPAYPKPQGMTVKYCWLQPLNLTLVYVLERGSVSTLLSTNATMQPQRFEELASAMSKIALPDGHRLNGAPTFITFAGMEWDFKNWKCQHPKSHSDWNLALDYLAMQNREARKRWPAVRATFTRTMFLPTYGTFRCNCCAVESDFYHFNRMLRRVSRFGFESRHSLKSGEQPLDFCSPHRLYALDLQRMMRCTDSTGTCSSRTHWTADGLHPSFAVYLQYIRLSLHAAADVGELCGSRLDR